MNIPNLNAMSRPMSQFGPAQSMAQGYSNNVNTAMPAFQQMRQMQAQNPNIARQTALRGLAPQSRDARQFAALQQQAKPVQEFAGYMARQAGTGNAGYQQALSNMASGTQYADALRNFGSWKDADTKRANASGMLSGGLGALIPDLAMMAIPGAGLAKIATGTALGGITGGPVGAALGGLGSAVAPSVKLPGLNALKAPVQAAANVAKQFANPMTAARQVGAMGIGSLNGRNT